MAATAGNTPITSWQESDGSFQVLSIIHRDITCFEIFLGAETKIAIGGSLGVRV